MKIKHFPHLTFHLALWLGVFTAMVLMMLQVFSGKGVSAQTNGQVITLTGSQNAQVICAGQRLTITRPDNKTASLNCIPNPPTATPVATRPPSTPTTVAGTNPTTAPTGMTMPTGNNSMAMGIWTPNTKYDTCTKAEHDSFFVIGPDGKKYPTWHAPVMTRSNGTTCTFGHDHGRDPSKYQFWSEIKQHFAYDADRNGQISAAELATSGVPFGYVNEQMMLAQNTNVIARHEDHVGHKVQFVNGEGDLDEDARFRGMTTTTGGLVIPVEGAGTDDWQDTGVKCNFFQKLHQGVSTPDAFTNNLHELIMHTKCTSPAGKQNIFPNSTSLVSGMIAFGAPGSMNEFCADADRNAPAIQVPGGVTETNRTWPSDTESGRRSIITRGCVERTVLVPSGRFSDNPYEIWNGQLILQKTDGQQIARVNGGWEVLDPLRYYDPRPDTQKLAGYFVPGKNLTYTLSWCFDRDSNGDSVKGTCDGVTPGLAWDDPRSPYVGVHRGQYMEPHRLFNDGGAEIIYTDVFGKKGQTTYFPGSVKQYVQSVDAEKLKIGQMVNSTKSIDPRSVVLSPRGDAHSRSIMGPGFETVHAPN